MDQNLTTNNIHCRPIIFVVSVENVFQNVFTIAVELVFFINYDYIKIIYMWPYFSGFLGVDY